MLDLAVAKTVGCFSQADSKILLLKTALTQQIEHGEVEFVPT